MSLDPVEARARRYLRLFPGWMRDGRGEEVVGLVLDQVPPGTERLPRRSRLDLVRAGLHARRRGTPPMRVRSAVSSVRSPFWSGRGAAIPLEWRPWLVSELQHRSFVWRCAFRIDLNEVFSLSIMSAFWFSEFGGSLFWLLPSTTLALTLLRGAWFLLFRRRTWRRRVTVANGLDLEGRPLPPDDVTVGWVEPLMVDRRFVHYGVGGTVAALVTGPVAWHVLAEGPRRVPAAPAGWTAALVAGLVALAVGWAVRAVRRIDRSGADDRAKAAARRPVTDDWVTVASGAFWGAFAAGLVAFVGRVAGLHVAVVAAVPIAGLLGTLVLLRAERSMGRPVGVGDISPLRGPQLVVRRIEDLPPPPQRPDTPAFG